MAEQIFQKGRADFKKILEDQKKQESDPKFAISDALQEYKDQIEKTAGYKSFAKLDKAGIRQDVINFVDNYTISDLDSIKGMEYEEAIRLQKNTEKKISEFEGLEKQGILRKEELDYIKETVGKTNDQLKQILGVGTRLTLAFRDIKKELKPLKLAQRVGLTRIPIIGRRIERAIEAEDVAEREALGLKRQLRRKTAREERKFAIDNELDDVLPGTENQKMRERTAKRAVQDLFAPRTQPSLGMTKEGMIEEERESDEQFETSSGLLEDILEENKLTNELLQGKKGGKGLGGEGGGTSLLEALGLGAAFKSGKGIIGKLGSFLKNPKTLLSGGANLARTGLTAVTGLGATTLAALAAIIAPFAAITFAAKKKGDEYIELMKRGQIRAEDSPQYYSRTSDSFDEAGAGYIPPEVSPPGTFDNTKFLETLGEKPYSPDELTKILQEETEKAKLRAKEKTLASNDLSKMSMDETYLPDSFVPSQDKNLRASEITTSGVERSVNSVSNNYNNNTVVNQQNNDNKRIDNTRNDSSNVSIGTANPDSKAQILSNVY